MATDVKIDLASRDFVDSDDGGWEEVDDSSTAVVCQIECHENEWWGDPEAGSGNHAILTSGEPVTPEEMLDSTRRALLRMQRAGVISDLKAAIGVTDEETGALELDLAWVDRASSKPADLAYSPLDGHP